ncbi:MAG TPA: hypothetical protein VFH45_04615 [Acidimicrobiales bacterium]|nr:hypothetical protein [Acidimicrobiales bacterium]
MSGPRHPARRLAAAAAGLTFVLLAVLASPARGGAPSVRIDSPASGAVVSSNGFSVSGTVSATNPQGVIDGDLELIVTSEAGHPGYTTTRSSWCGQSSCDFDISVPPLAWNGAYSVAIQATEEDPATGQHEITATSSMALAVPPAAPGQLTATPPTAAPGPDGTQASVTLSWTANKEPDLIGYEVSRSPQGAGSWPKAVTSASFVDDGAQAGNTYTYSVVAVRQGADTGSTVSSQPATATAAVPSTGPAPTASSSSSSSSSGAGRSGTSPTSTAVAGGPASRSTRSTRTASVSATSPTISDLAQFNALLAQTKSASGLPALPAPQEQAPPGPTTTVPSTGNVAAIGPLPPPRDDGAGPSQLQTAAALALVALMAAVGVHLLWLRRQAARRTGS